jgi:prepilin-type N-terminal cleavage/methylation domain-containing protein
MNRPGVTLIELIVVIVILAISITVVGVAARTTPALQGANSVAAAIALVRDSSVRTRRSVTSYVMFQDSVGAVTAFPDGRIIPDSNLRARLVIAEERHVTR